MKLKHLLLMLTALAVGATSTFAADDDTPLAKEMTKLNKSLRTLKRQKDDAAKKAENLKLVDDMKANVAASMKLDPAKTKDQPAADKPAYLEKYKKQLEDLDKALDGLKAGIEKGDADAVSKGFDQLSDLKEKGHKDFAPEE
jgi:soluble cytochrome b562